MIDRAKLEERALAIIHKCGRASTALLQRELNIGYLDSLRILVSLERKGLVVENGSEMRESLLRSLTSAASKRN